MQVLPGLVVLLAAADDELAFLDGHIELLVGEAGNRKRDTKTLGLLGVAGETLDIVGRVAVGRLGDAIERPLDLVESEQKRTGKRRNSGHGCKVLMSDFAGAHRAPRWAEYGVGSLRVQELGRIRPGAVRQAAAALPSRTRAAGRGRPRRAPAR